MKSYYFKEYFSNLSNSTQVFEFANRIGSIETNSSVHVELWFSQSDFLQPDSLLLLVNLFNGLRSKGVAVHLTFYGNKKYAAFRFAQRINFFSHLNLNIPEEFERHDSTGRFLEISKFDRGNIYKLQEKLIMVLDKNALVDKNVLALLYFCFNEILDNVLNHSGMSHGWVSAQHLPYNSEIRICISDSGMGIHSALTATGRFNNYSEADSVKNCIVNGVTNGKGQGFGLYATSEFLRRNKGKLVIQSGSYRLQVNRSMNILTQSPLWNGTFVMLSVNTKQPVNYSDIFPRHRNLEEEFVDYKEGLVDNLRPINEALW